MSLTDVASAIVAEPLKTDKGTLRRYRHAIQDTVNHRVLMPQSPQYRIKQILKGRVGLTFDQQAEYFRQVETLTSEARPGNVKAQSCRAIAAKSLSVIDARRQKAEADRKARESASRYSSRYGSQGSRYGSPAPVKSWEDDDVPAPAKGW